MSSLKLPVHLPHVNFVGCLKHVHFNTFNILHDLHNENPIATYYSLYPVELGCHPVEAIPVTFQPRSHIKLQLNRTQSMDIEFQFRTSRNATRFKIAEGNIMLSEGEKRRWQLWVRSNDIKLEVRSSESIPFILSNDNSLQMQAQWNRVSLTINTTGLIMMTVNEESVRGRYGSKLSDVSGELLLGLLDHHPHPPVACCMQNIRVNQRLVNPQTLREAGRSLVVGKVSLDDCRQMSPCNVVSPCEHGGRCVAVPENGTYNCDCSNTGYIGRTCHFAVYRQSCEEIYLMDKQHSGIYMIDVDRNGPMPPSHVICELDTQPDGRIATRTVIEHNIQHQVVVREKGKQNSFVMNVIYRDFNIPMLHRLIHRSKQCRQYIKYECNDAPLR